VNQLLTRPSAAPIKDITILKTVNLMLQSDSSNSTPISSYQFPRWANYLLPACLVVVIGMVTYLPTVMTLGFSPGTKDVGYRPSQPVAFDHAMHVGALGMDCRYCHTTVEQAAFAAVPPTQTCMACHGTIKPDSPALERIREGFAEGEAIPWRKVHDLPDYVYFNHAAHVAQGVGCNTCHGQVNEMTQVFQVESLSMGWCLDCHREPEKHLRPRDQITNMEWDAQRDAGMPQRELGKQLRSHYGIAGEAFMTSCSTCHR
jgi:hypothetical protein